MNGSWFLFSFPNFSYAFLSVLLEGVPFLLLGTILSGIIDQYLPSRVMTRFLPRNVFLGICVSAAMGLVFPMCECGIVPVIRRLIGKGLPVSNAIAYMLAAPIVNPIVALSTYAAFGGQSAVEVTMLRMGLGYFVAILAALAVHNLPLRLVLREGIAAVPMRENEQEHDHECDHDHEHEHEHEHEHGHEHHHPHQISHLGRAAAALRVAVSDFLDVMIYFVLGVAISSLFSTSVNQELIQPLASNDWLATFSLMVLAIILSLCSTSDAFIAATFGAFPMTAKLAFLVLGPMLDLKLLFIYSAVFRKRFVIGLALGLFVLIGLICVRLNVLNL